MIHLKCKDCGVSCFEARRNGFRILMEWSRPAAGNYVLALSAAGQPMVTDLGQDLPGGYAAHLCEAMRKRFEMTYRTRPPRRTK